MAESTRGKCCNTARPAPKFMCPTSEFPICPRGSPTSRPEHCSKLCGYLANRASHTGVCAEAMALSALAGASPQPSSTHNTMGRGTLFITVSIHFTRHAFLFPMPRGSFQAR